MWCFTEKEHVWHEYSQDGDEIPSLRFSHVCVRCGVRRLTKP